MKTVLKPKLGISEDCTQYKAFIVIITTIHFIDMIGIIALNQQAIIIYSPTFSCLTIFENKPSSKPLFICPFLDKILESIRPKYSVSKTVHLRFGRDRWLNNRKIRSSSPMRNSLWMETRGA